MKYQQQEDEDNLFEWLHKGVKILKDYTGWDCRMATLFWHFIMSKDSGHNNKVTVLTR